MSYKKLQSDESPLFGSDYIIIGANLGCSNHKSQSLLMTIGRECLSGRLPPDPSPAALLRTQGSYHPSVPWRSCAACTQSRTSPSTLSTLPCAMPYRGNHAIPLAPAIFQLNKHDQSDISVVPEFGQIATPHITALEPINSAPMITPRDGGFGQFESALHYR
jgi:hypothetical protein